MPAQLTTIKNKHVEPKQPLVITCTSDSGTFYDSDTDSLQHPDDSNTDEHQSQHPNDTTTHMEADTQAGFLDYPPRQGAPSPDSQPGPSTKVELQGTNESFISVSPFTPLDPSTKMEVEIETVSSDSDHPSDAQLRHSEDATGSPSTATSRRSATLLPPADVQAPTSRREPHVRQANRQLFNSLHAVYGRSDPSQPIEEDDDDDDEEEEDDWPTHATARYPSWSDRGEHPGMGWILNDPLSADFYKIVIPDPTITTTSLMIAPYVTYSIQPHLSEVSATYGKGYPTHTRKLAPTPVNYACPPATPDHISLLTEHPYAEAITAVVKRHFPTAHVAALNQFQHFQEEKYMKQAKIQRLQGRLAKAREQEMDATEEAMCVLSTMENANFFGRLFCQEHDVLEALSAQPNAADHFLRHALSFDGIIPNSALDPMPNPWRTTHGPDSLPNVTPAFLRHLEAGRQCIKGNHRHCSHPLDHEQQDDLREQANLHHSAHVAITRRLDQDVEQKRAAKPRKRCWGCRKFGHSRPNCPNASRREPRRSTRASRVTPAPTYPF